MLISYMSTGFNNIVNSGGFDAPCKEHVFMLTLSTSVMYRQGCKYLPPVDHHLVTTTGS